jgi:hypothetical protein
VPKSKLQKAWEITISLVSLALLVGPLLTVAIFSVVAFRAYPEMRYWIGLAWVTIVIGISILARWENEREARGRGAIIDYCEAAGCSVVKIKAFKNHYRVTFLKDGREQAGKCVASPKRVEWLEGDPNT